MGKRGRYSLMFPKATGEKISLEKVVEIISKNGGSIDSKDLTLKLQHFFKTRGKDISENTAIKKQELATYFYLVTRRDKEMHLTEYGYRYSQSTTNIEKIEILFEVISSNSFGRNNEATGSDSNVEPPLVLLKLCKDLGKVSKDCFGCILFYLEAEGIDYKDALKKLKNSNASKEKERIKGLGGGKFFDTKLVQFFNEMGMIDQLDSKSSKGFYKLNKEVVLNFIETIDAFAVLPSGDSSINSHQFKKTEKENIKSKQSLSDLINRIKESSGFKDPIKIKRRSSNRTGVSTNSVIGKNLKKSKITDAQKWDIGLCGEKVVYDWLINQKESIMKELNLSSNEAISEITWFNKGFENVESIAEWEDQSKGKGCDIQVITNKRTLFLEVKSSLETTNYFTLTGNELRFMEKERKNYFILKINKLKNIFSDSLQTNHDVIRDPFKRFKNTSNIKEIIIYTKDQASS